MIGRIIQNRYRIETFLGRGSQGEVFRIVDLEAPNQPLCIKFFFSTPGVKHEFFVNEFRFAMGLRHPGLIRLYEAGLLMPEKRPFTIGEYVCAKSLTAFLHTPPTPLQFYQVATQTLEALQYLHRSGLVHLDVKPSNLLMEEDGLGLRVKLIDYATLYAPGSSAAVPYGTLFYQSPRILRGSKPREQDDLYSLGALLFRWITGKLPYDQFSPEEFAARTRLGAPPFQESDWRDLGSPGDFIHHLLTGAFSTAEQAKRSLQQSHGSSREQPLPLTFPTVRIPKATVDQLEKALQLLLAGTSLNPKTRKMILVTGPTGSGKSTLVQQVISTRAANEGIPFVSLPCLPQSSVLSTARLLSERFTETHVFSGLDPLDTTQRLVSRTYRRYFFSLLLQMIQEITRKTNGLVLCFESVSFDDFLLAEFLHQLSLEAQRGQWPLGIVVTADLSALSPDSGDRQKQSPREESYLHRFLEDCVALHVALKPWPPHRLAKYLRSVLGQVPRNLLQQIHAQKLCTPGLIREYIEEAQESGRLALHRSRWQLTGAKSSRPPLGAASAPRYAADPRHQFLRAVLPLLPQPVEVSVLEPLFHEDPEYRGILLGLVQDGFILRDETRYFCSRQKSLLPQIPGKALRLLDHLTRKNPLYLLPLCWLNPRKETINRLAVYLEQLHHSDRYWPVEDLLQFLLKGRSVPAALRGLLLYHLGRIHSLHGNLHRARRYFAAASRTFPTRARQERMLAAVEFSNVSAKMGKHADEIRALRGALQSVSTADERAFVQGLTGIAQAIHRGRQGWPLPEVENHICALTRRDFSGRLALRYAQGLLWCGQESCAALWIRRAVSHLKSSGQHFRLARALRMQGKICRDGGNLSRALALNERALALLQEQYLPQEEIETLLGIFYLHLRMDQFEALDDTLSQMARLIPTLSDPRYELIWPELLAMAQQRKSPNQALALFRQQEKLARSLQSQEHLYISLANQALLEKSLGHVPGATRTFRRARAVFSCHGKAFPPRLVEGHRHLIETFSQSPPQGHL